MRFCESEEDSFRKKVIELDFIARMPKEVLIEIGSGIENSVNQMPREVAWDEDIDDESFVDWSEEIEQLRSGKKPKTFPEMVFDDDLHMQKICDILEICEACGERTLEFSYDDNGRPFSVNGEKLSEFEYTICGIHFFTDENGDLVSKDPIITKFLQRQIPFELEVAQQYAKIYAQMINNNVPFSWANFFPGAEYLTTRERDEIRNLAIENGLVKRIPIVERDGYQFGFPDFGKAGLVKAECILEKEYWPMSDKKQFEQCNLLLKKMILENTELKNSFTKEQVLQIMEGKTPDGFTWHHSETDGVMQLVPFGYHNMITHNGGRCFGMWAYGKRS